MTQNWNWVSENFFAQPVYRILSSEFSEFYYYVLTTTWLTTTHNQQLGLKSKQEIVKQRETNDKNRQRVFVCRSRNEGTVQGFAAFVFCLSRETQQSSLFHNVLKNLPVCFVSGFMKKDYSNAPKTQAPTAAPGVVPVVRASSRGTEEDRSPLYTIKDRSEWRSLTHSKPASPSDN